MKFVRKLILIFFVLLAGHLWSCTLLKPEKEKTDATPLLLFFLAWNFINGPDSFSCYYSTNGTCYTWKASSTADFTLSPYRNSCSASSGVSVASCESTPELWVGYCYSRAVSGSSTYESREYYNSTLWTASTGSANCLSFTGSNWQPL